MWKKAQLSRCQHLDISLPSPQHRLHHDGRVSQTSRTRTPLYLCVRMGEGFRRTDPGWLMRLFTPVTALRDHRARDSNNLWGFFQCWLSWEVLPSQLRLEEWSRAMPGQQYLCLSKSCWHFLRGCDLITTRKSHFSIPASHLTLVLCLCPEKTLKSCPSLLP